MYQCMYSHFLKSEQMNFIERGFGNVQLCVTTILADSVPNSVCVALRPVVFKPLVKWPHKWQRITQGQQYPINVVSLSPCPKCQCNSLSDQLFSSHRAFEFRAPGHFETRGLNDHKMTRHTIRWNVPRIHILLGSRGLNVWTVRLALWLACHSETKSGKDDLQITLITLRHPLYVLLVPMGPKLP